MQPHPQQRQPHLWDQPPRPPPVPPALLAPLLAAADSLGRLVQYRHQGFLPNARQQRMAGLAAIELAQALRRLVSERAQGPSGGVRACVMGW